MQLRYSEYFNIDKEKFDELGVFNGFVMYDSKYFLSPKLIKDTEEKSFLNSYNKLLKKFNNIIALIDRTQVPDKKKDKFYCAAVNAIKSKENGYIGLGYSKAGKEGRGIGEKLATSIAFTCFQLIKQDEIEPELFELLGVFKEQINLDRISDMIIKIIEEDISEYTQHIAKELRLNVVLNNGYYLPYNTYDNNKILYFLPTSMLSKLPIGEKAFHATVYESEEIIEFMNTEFGEEYGKYLQHKKYREIAIIKKKKIIDDLIVKYRSYKDEAYDFVNDPDNNFKWIDDIIDLVNKNPITLNEQDSIYNIVKNICEEFQNLMENTNAYKLLYDDRETKKNEKTSQQAFQLFVQSYCKANNLDISAEPNGGQGAVDFKFSQGLNKVLVELKLSTSTIKTLNHCLDTQIEVYKKSEGTNKAILLILMVGKDVKKAEDKIEKLTEYKNKLGDKIKYLSDIIYVDAIWKKSASVR